MTDRQQLRMTWRELPASIHRAVEGILDGPVVEATSQPNSYSPGSADRVRAENGNRAFVKAVCRERNADTYDLHRRELAVLRMLPGSLPAPRLLGAVEDRDWVALIIEDVDGAHPGETPTESEVSAVLSALEAMPAVRGLDAWGGLPEARTELAAAFTRWGSIRSGGESVALPASAREHLDELERLAEGAAAALEGDHLLHLDLRSDNILFDRAGRTWLVDWPGAGVGARWFDALTFLLDARMHGSAIDAEQIIAVNPLFTDATDGDIDAVLSGMAAYFFDSARSPAPANMPTLRAFQYDEGVAALVWLGQRRGWDSTARERPWPSTGRPAVQLVRLDPAAIDALAAEDILLADALAPFPLGSFFVEPSSAHTWRYRSAQIAASPSDADWITRVIYDPDRGIAVGQGGFHGPPDAAGMVEVGYAVDPRYRRQGYARAALVALIERARVEPSVTVVRATIRPDNTPSRNLIAQFGFVEVGEQWDDEDGLETIFELVIVSSPLDREVAATVEP